jgi:hypothetical protein
MEFCADGKKKRTEKTGQLFCKKINATGRIRLFLFPTLTAGWRTLRIPKGASCLSIPPLTGSIRVVFSFHLNSDPHPWMDAAFEVVFSF